MNYNVSQAREGKEGKTYWMKLGYAFEKDGKVSSIKLDALPLPNEKGEVWLNLFPDDRDRNAGATGGGASGGSPWPVKETAIDDAIPF